MIKTRVWKQLKSMLKRSVFLWNLLFWSTEFVNLYCKENEETGSGSYPFLPSFCRGWRSYELPHLDIKEFRKQMRHIKRCIISLRWRN